MMLLYKKLNKNYTLQNEKKSMNIRYKLAILLFGLSIFSGTVYASEDGGDDGMHEKRRRSGKWYAPKFVRLCKDPAIRWVFFNVIGVGYMMGSNDYTNLLVGAGICFGSGGLFILENKC